MDNILLIKNSNRVVYLPVSDIVFCQANDYWIKIIIMNDTVIINSETLKKMEELINDEKIFRIHRSYLVNLLYIHRIMGHYEYLEMHNKYEVPVARRKRPKLKQKFKEMPFIL